MADVWLILFICVAVAEIATVGFAVASTVGLIREKRKKPKINPKSLNESVDLNGTNQTEANNQTNSNQIDTDKNTKEDSTVSDGTKNQISIVDGGFEWNEGMKVEVLEKEKERNELYHQMKTRIEEMKTRIGEKDKRNQTLKDRNDLLVGEKEKMMLENKEYQERNREYQERNRKYQERNKEYQESIAQLQQKIHGLKGLLSAKEGLVEKKEFLAKENERLISENRQLLKGVEELKKEITFMTEKNSKSGEALEDDYLSKIERMKKKWMAEAHSLGQENDVLRLKNKDQESKIKQLKEEYERRLKKVEIDKHNQDRNFDSKRHKLKEVVSLSDSSIAITNYVEQECQTNSSNTSTFDEVPFRKVIFLFLKDQLCTKSFSEGILIEIVDILNLPVNYFRLEVSKALKVLLKLFEYDSRFLTKWFSEDIKGHELITRKAIELYQNLQSFSNEPKELNDVISVIAQHIKIMDERGIDIMDKPRSKIISLLIGFPSKSILHLICNLLQKMDSIEEQDLKKWKTEFDKLLLPKFINEVCPLFAVWFSKYEKISKIVCIPAFLLPCTQKWIPSVKQNCITLHETLLRSIQLFKNEAMQSHHGLERLIGSVLTHIVSSDSIPEGLDCISLCKLLKRCPVSVYKYSLAMLCKYVQLIPGFKGKISDILSIKKSLEKETIPFTLFLIMNCHVHLGISYVQFKDDFSFDMIDKCTNLDHIEDEYKIRVLLTLKYFNSKPVVNFDGNMCMYLLKLLQEVSSIIGSEEATLYRDFFDELIIESTSFLEKNMNQLIVISKSVDIKVLFHSILDQLYEVSIEHWESIAMIYFRFMMDSNFSSFNPQKLINFIQQFINTQSTKQDNLILCCQVWEETLKNCSDKFIHKNLVQLKKTLLEALERTSNEFLERIEHLLSHDDEGKSEANLNEIDLKLEEDSLLVLTEKLCQELQKKVVNRKKITHCIQLAHQLLEKSWPEDTWDAITKTLEQNLTSPIPLTMVPSAYTLLHKVISRSLNRPKISSIFMNQLRLCDEQIAMDEVLKCLQLVSDDLSMKDFEFLLQFESIGDKKVYFNVLATAVRNKKYLSMILKSSKFIELLAVSDEDLVMILAKSKILNFNASNILLQESPKIAKRYPHCEELLKAYFDTEIVAVKIAILRILQDSFISMGKNLNTNIQSRFKTTTKVYRHLNEFWNCEDSSKQLEKMLSHAHGIELHYFRFFKELLSVFRIIMKPKEFQSGLKGQFSLLVTHFLNRYGGNVQNVKKTNLCFQNIVHCLFEFCKQSEIHENAETVRLVLIGLRLFECLSDILYSSFHPELLLKSWSKIHIFPLMKWISNMDEKKLTEIIVANRSPVLLSNVVSWNIVKEFGDKLPTASLIIVSRLYEQLPKDRLKLIDVAIPLVKRCVQDLPLGYYLDFHQGRSESNDAPLLSHKFKPTLREKPEHMITLWNNLQPLKVDILEYRNGISELSRLKYLVFLLKNLPDKLFYSFEFFSKDDICKLIEESKEFLSCNIQSTPVMLKQIPKSGELNQTVNLIMALADRNERQNFLPCSKFYIEALTKFFQNVENISNYLNATKETPVLQNFLMKRIPIVVGVEAKREIFKCQVGQRVNTKDIYKVERKNLLHSASQEFMKRSKTDFFQHWRIQFKEEKETLDLRGVRREFVTMMSKELFQQSFWKRNDHHQHYPSQSAPLEWMEFSGKFLAKCLYEGELVDARLCRFVWKKLLGMKLSYQDIESVDKDLYTNSFLWVRDNDITDLLYLHFDIETDGKTVELMKNGSQISVTNDNKMEYLDCLVQYKLNYEMERQFQAMIRGFSEIISISIIQMFTPEELELVLCGLDSINVKDLQAHTIYKFGYDKEKPTIKSFWDYFDHLSVEKKKKLLQFVTGSYRVPLEGFSGLNPQFTIQKIKNGQDRLPSSSTCFNLLKLPEYEAQSLPQKFDAIFQHGAEKGFQFS